ncbi:MAG: hypothetical protein J0I09_00775 [Sphingobacteriia bacterium]|nr:hypothetical protein [Sphingobacteriia bacterium]
METQLKKEVLKLVDDCNDEILLQEAKELLQVEKDWWDELTDEDKNLLNESETEYNKGNFTTHSTLMQEFEAWKKK